MEHESYKLNSLDRKDEDIERFLKEGKTRKEIAEIYGVTRDTVGRWIKLIEKRAGRYRPTKNEIEKAKKLLRSVGYEII